MNDFAVNDDHCILKPEMSNWNQDSQMYSTSEVDSLLHFHLSQIHHDSSLLNRQSPMEFIEYQSMASKMGFLVGQDLEQVLHRSESNNNISGIYNMFKHRLCSAFSQLTLKQNLVLGVRVPSKEHVSEIVGKEGKKIKMISQITGALIATPNKYEDHVFIIEAVPDIAIKVGQTIQQLAEQITRNKLGNIVSMFSGRSPLAKGTIRVPQRFVGKVIGTQGSIITSVQIETGTKIKNPFKGLNGDFEISVYENGHMNSDRAWLHIYRAKQLIAHLVMRLGSTTKSSDEENGTNSSFTPEWIWPDVSPMDDVDAKEIIDRILRSSKAKVSPSTSPAESANVDSLIMPSITSIGMSPPFSISLLNDKKSISDFDSVNPTPQIFPSNFYSSNIQPQISESSHRGTETNSLTHQYNSSNDSAFYDSHYANVYSPSNRDGNHMYMSENYPIEHNKVIPNNCHNLIADSTAATAPVIGNTSDSSRLKPPAFYSSTNDTINSIYEKVKYLWENSNEFSNSSSVATALNKD